MRKIHGMLLAATMLTACAGSPRSVTPPAADEASAWTLLGATPAPRANHAAIYDAARDRMLVFGGAGNDLWAQPLSGPNAGTWARLEAGGEAPPPVGAVLAIDEAKDTLMVFANDSLERAWMLPLSGKGAWSLAGFGQGPQIQLSFSLAVDPVGRRLFAYTSGTPELWALPLDGAGTWQQIAGAPIVDGFSCRDDLVFDAARARLLVLSGGWPRGNVYALPLGGAPTWTQINGDPAWFEYGSTAIYDAKAGRFLVQGPGTSTWLWSFAVNDTAPAWTHLPVSGTAPADRFGASAVYDARHQRLVAFGGSSTDSASSLHNDTWALSLGDAPAWSQVGALDVAVPTAQGASLGFDPDTDTVLRFGGSAPEQALPSLRFDAATATWVSLGDPPVDILSWGAGAWDPEAHRLVSFGGYGYVDEGETWALDVSGAAWTQIDGGGERPGARVRHSLVHDAAGHRMVLFAGSGNTAEGPATTLADVWTFALDTHAWTRLTPTGPGPSPRSDHAAAFDDTGRRMLVHGGYGIGGTLSDTWMLEMLPSPRWVRLHPAGNAPPALADHFATYDAASGRFLLVASTPSSSTSDGVTVWALSTEGKPRWHRYCPKGTRPATVDGMVATGEGLFVTAQGSAFRFNPTAPTCD